MEKKNRMNRIAIVVSFIGVLLLVCYVFYLQWQKEKNTFVYEEHLNDTVVTVDDQAVTLREFGYYIAKMEKDVQEKALIYNANNPMEYWNVHFSAGLDSGYMFEYAWDYAVADCVCDLIFVQKAKEEGYSLSENGYRQAKIKAEELYSTLSTEQMKKTGLTMELLTMIEERRLLVQLYTNSCMDENELSLYMDNIMKYISGNSNMVMSSEVICNEEIKNNVRMGTITVN